MADKAADAQVLLNSGRKYRSYSYEERLNVIMLSDGGMSSTEIKAMTGIDDGLVRYWIRRYRKYGIDGLKRKRYAAPIVPVNFTADTKAKGFIRYVDNPEILTTQVDKLRRNGLDDDSIIISMSPDTIFNEMAGSTIVVNSLYDLASDLGGIIRLLSFALKKCITVVSLSDGRLEVTPKDKGILEILEKYAYTEMNRLKNRMVNTKMKRTYAGLNNLETMVEPESSVLAGSVTDVPIEVNDVTVEDFSAGFDNDGNDFETITFD